MIRYENLVGDRFMEITSGPGELRKLPSGGMISINHTQPALDLDALLGGLRPVVKGLNGDQVNQISNAILELLQGEGGALSRLLSETGTFSQTLGDRYQVISEVIQNLNEVLGTIDEKSVEFDASVDELQKLVTGLAEGRDPIAGAIPPLASAETDLTDMLVNSRRPLQGVLENLRPLATELDNRKAEVNQSHRAVGRELPAAQFAWCVRIVLQLLHLRGDAQIQRAGRQRHFPADRRRAGPVEGQVFRQWIRRSGRASSASQSWCLS